VYKCKLYECKDEVGVLRRVSKNFGFEKNNGRKHSKEVAQFAVLNKPYDKLYSKRYSHSACMQLTDADFIVCDLSLVN